MNKGPRDWQNLFATPRFRYIEVALYWGEEYRSLYRGLRYIEVRYIEVPLYWDKEYRSLYRGFRYIEVRYIEVPLYWDKKKSFVIPRTSLYRGSLYRGSTVLG